MSQRQITGACALSVWTYNAEVQGSDARIRNHFEYITEITKQNYTVEFCMKIVCIIARQPTSC